MIEVKQQMGEPVHGRIEAELRRLYGETLFLPVPLAWAEVLEQLDQSCPAPSTRALAAATD